MSEAVIVDAIRTPIGRAMRGSLRHKRADDLAAIPLKALVERNPGVDFARHRRHPDGLRLPQRRAGLQHRPQRRAARRDRPSRARDVRQPLLRFVAADAADGLPRDHGRRGRPVHRRRCRGGLALPASTRSSIPTRRSTAPRARRTTSTSRWGSRPRTSPSAATSRARRRTSGRSRRRRGRSTPRPPATSTPRSSRSTPPRRPSRTRRATPSRSPRDGHQGRRPAARHDAREARRAQAGLQGGRHRHRRQRLPAQRRRRRRAGDVGGAREGARARAAGPHHRLLGRRHPARDHGPRPDPGGREGPRRRPG